MAKKRNIAVVAGGYSSEHDVSIRSAKGIIDNLDTNRYNVYLVILEKDKWYVSLPNQQQIAVDKNDFSAEIGNEKIRFDLAYITIHGTPGEDGLLQGYFDMLNIPYSCCGVLAASLTFNKYACTHYLRSFGINAANSILLRQGDCVSNQRVIAEIGLPCFIKSNVGGSSYGCTKVKTEEEIQPAIALAFNEGREVIIESYMKGTEVTCGVFKTKKRAVALPVTEVVTHNEFFDYDAKYKGEVDEITPARITNELRDKIQTLTLKIYDIIGCHGIIRTDYIIYENGQINLLEINTTPGMTETSFVPQQIRAAGMTVKDVLTELIEDNF